MRLPHPQPSISTIGPLDCRGLFVCYTFDMRWQIKKEIKSFEHSPCEVCGYLTFAADERGRFFICPVCFWEDDEFHLNANEPCGGPNHGLSLNEAKSNFHKYGAVIEEMVKHVRPPLPEEIPNNLA